MTIQEVNAKTLSNGMNRKDYFDSVVDWYSQGAMEYNGYYEKILNIPYDTQSDRQKYDVYMHMQPCHLESKSPASPPHIPRVKYSPSPPTVVVSVTVQPVAVPSSRHDMTPAFLWMTR